MENTSSDPPIQVLKPFIIACASCIFSFDVLLPLELPIKLGLKAIIFHELNLYAIENFIKFYYLSLGEEIKKREILRVKVYYLGIIGLFYIANLMSILSYPLTV